MKLQRVEVENFFSYRSAELDLEKRGLVLVSGPNGIGKSALFVDAVPWALFGETVKEKTFGSTSREFKKDDVVNRSAGSDCRVRVEFQIGKKNYSITRYRKHKTHGNGVELFEGKKDRSGEGIGETQQKIEELIGLNFQAFVNSIIFGQGPVKRFTQATDSERRQILEDFLQLKLYTQAKDLVQKDIKALNLHRNEVAQRIRDLETAIETREEDLGFKEEDLKSHDSILEAERRERSTKLKEWDRRRKSLLERSRKQEPEIKASEVDLGKLEKKILSEKIRRTLEKKERNLDFETSDMVKQGLRLNDLVTNLGREMEKIGACPECKRPFAEDEVEERKKDLQAKIDSTLGEIEDLTADHEEVLDQFKDVRKRLEFDDELKQKADQIREDLVDLESEHEETIIELNRIEEEIRVLDNRTESENEIRKSKVKEIEDLKTRIAGSKKELIKEKKDQKQLEYDFFHLSFWEEGFSPRGVKDLVYNKSVDFHNENLRMLSQRLTRGAIEIQFQKGGGDRILVDVDIKKAAQSYVTASGGQSKRIDLCVALSFQRLVESGFQNVNLSVFDEFDSSLDKPGIKMFKEYLEEEAERKGTVFVISHHPELQDEFDQVITIDYEGGVSSLPKN